MSFIIRKGKERDMASVLDLLKELAIIKGKENEVVITIYDLINAGFSTEKLFNAYVAEKNEKIVGFALFCKTYSTNGRSIILEDIYVNNENKKSGIGLALFSKFLEYAIKNKIHRLEWAIKEEHENLIKMYQRAGAKVLYDTRIFEMNKAVIKKLATENFTLREEDTKGKVIIRKGEMKDMSSVLDLIKELAKYKNSTCDIDVYDLMKDGYIKNPFFHTFVAEVNDEIVGMLLFYHTFSTLNGKSLNLEDLHVKAEYRTMGIGKALNHKFFEYAYNNKKSRIQQAIYDWDIEAIKRCEKFGAKMLNDIRILQLSDKSLHHFIYEN